MSNEIKVVPGEKYGRLTIIKEVEPYISPKGKKMRKFLCQCDCNSAPIEVHLNSLRRGVSTSCGCYQKEKLKETHKKNHKTNTYDLTGECGTGYTTKGEEFLFDLEDYPKIKEYCWCIDDKGYVATNVNKKQVRMHRFLMDCPEDMVIDHIDHCKNNNCKSNLRVCTIAENSRNLSIAKNNTSGVTGVRWHKQNSKWLASICINGKIINLGSYINKEDAIKARLEAEKKYFGEFSNNKTMNT